MSRKKDEINEKKWGFWMVVFDVHHQRPEIYKINTQTLCIKI
jgi:hypothetical protein